MICIQKKHLCVLAVALFFITKQHAMDPKSKQQNKWSESIRDGLSKFAQRSEGSYADIRQSYARLGQPAATNTQPTNSTKK